MDRTLHIFLDSPAGHAADVQSDDVVIDHRVDASGLLDVQASRLVATDVGARHHHDAARDAYLRWIATVGDRELRCGESLKTLLAYRERLSLWWFLPIQVKHYVLHPLPALFQQIVWLKDRESSRALRDALEVGGPVMIHAATGAKAELFAAALAQVATSLDAADVSCTGTSESTNREGLLTRAKRMTRPLTPAGFHALGLWRRLTSRDDLPADCDVAIVTSTDEWTGSGSPSGPQHRYLTDVPERLTQRGFQVAWLPLLTGADEWKEFRELLADRPEPTLWPEPRALGESAKLASRGVSDVRSRFGSVRDELPGDPALSWDGLDLSEWIVGEIDEFLRMRAIFWMQAHELVGHQLDRVKPTVVLYRNEFYSLHRVVGAACRLHGTPGWSYQHGSIPRTHWVYQHDGRDVRDDADLVRGLPAPDLFLSYSDFVTDLVTANDYPRDRVATVGSLRHDISFERAGNANALRRVDMRARMGLPAERLVIVVCTQLKQTIPRWSELLVGGLRDADIDAHIVVKPHWNHRDDAAAHRTFERLDWDDWRLYDGDLDALLLASDVCVTGTSTTAMEAAIAGARVISVQDEHPWEPIPYVEDGLAVGVTDRDSMAAALRTVTSGDYINGWPERRISFLRKHMQNVEEPAVEALCRLLGEVAGMVDVAGDSDQ